MKCPNCDGAGVVKLPWHEHDPRTSDTCGICGGTGRFQSRVLDGLIARVTTDVPSDYRCLNGHPFSAPNAEHGGPWSTLICPVCGATATLHLAASTRERS